MGGVGGRPNLLGSSRQRRRPPARAVPRLGPAAAPKSLLGRSRARATCGGTPGTGADVLVAMEMPVSGFSWHQGGTQRVPPIRVGTGVPRAAPRQVRSPVPIPAPGSPWNRGISTALLCPPPPGSVPTLGGGRGGQGGEANSCFVSEGMGEAEMAASRLRAGLRRLGCLIKKWPRWPPPGTAGAFLRLLLLQRLGALLSTAHSTQGC